MIGDDRQPAIQQKIARAARLGLADDGNPASHGKGKGLGKAQIRAAIDECPRHRHEMGRRRLRGLHDILRYVADIAIEVGPDPRPSVGDVEHAHRLAIEKLRIRAAAGLRPHPQRRHRNGYGRRLSFNEALCLDETAQTCLGDISR